MSQFDEYPPKIFDPEDKPLLEEAVKAANAGALRSSYIMTWLCCAESIKRRFRIAAPRDGAANRIVGEFEQKELEERSIDKFLIEKAREYGFVTGADYLRLKQIYEKRCLFGHPYETDPLASEVLDAMNIATACLLSNPVRMRHGYLDSQASQIVDNKSFIDDFQPAVYHYAHEIIARSAPELLSWWIEKVWSKAKLGFFDPATPWLPSRVIWLSDEVLGVLDGVTVVTAFERSLADNPLISSICLARSTAFAHLSPLVADQVVSHLLEYGLHTPSHVAPLFEQKRKGTLSERQTSRLDEFLVTGNLNVLSQAGVRLKDYIPRVISDLKSYNWYTQNPVAELLLSVPSDQFDELSNSDQERLGRNILQAAEAAKTCASFIYEVSIKNKLIPANMVFGLVEEVFVNEVGNMRLKEKNLPSIMRLLGSLDDAIQSEIIIRVCGHIATARLKDPMRNTFMNVVQSVEAALVGSNVSEVNADLLRKSVIAAQSRATEEHDEKIKQIFGDD